MMKENCIISTQRPENRLVIHRLLRCMDVQTAVDVSISQNVYINIMRKKMQRKRVRLRTDASHTRFRLEN